MTDLVERLLRAAADTRRTSKGGMEYEARLFERAATALEAARGDAERLDWLLHALYRQDVVACGGEAYITMRCVGVPPADANEIRAAIDAARKEVDRG